MTTQLKQVLLVGLPKAGKTTFVAAFWHVISSEEVLGSLRIVSLGGDDEYLNLIRDSWISYQPLERTSQQDESVPVMHLKDTLDTKRCDLHIPDLSGETYRSQWIDREWTEKFDALAHESAALVVFVHPNQNIDPTEITTTARMLPPVEDNGRENAARATSTDEITEEVIWDPALANDIVQLVDIIQAYQGRMPNALRVAVIISAWDLVREYFASPQEYLFKKVSLLDQFLKSNSDTITSAVFGISATGIDLEDLQACNQIQENTTYSSERIEVVGGDQRDHDITRPVRWALGW